MTLNLPAGASFPNDPILFGTSNIAIIVDKARKKFERVTEDNVREHAKRIDPSVRFETATHGYEGFHLITDRGRITVLPGVVYIWLPITESVETFLDWLFINVYGLIPPKS